MWLARLRRRRAENPHLCQICGGDFVYPVDWQEATDTHLWVRMRCGECDSWREDTFTDEALDEFDQKLDVACGQIAEEADRLHREWRTKEADAFAAALDRDLIDAGDFAS
jgi:hypothetical protein